MKKYVLQSIILVLTIVISGPIRAQVSGTGEISKRTHNVDKFTAVEAGGAQEISLFNGDEYSVVVETNDNLHDKISIEVINGKLRFKYNKIKKYDEMKFYITAPFFDQINISGASELRTPDGIKGNNIKITSSGASEGKLSLDYTSVITQASGASEIKLEGKANSLVASASGASEIKAGELQTETSVITASGASECFVNAATSLTYTVSGTAEVRYTNKPKTLIIQDGKKTNKVVLFNDTTVNSHYDQYGDTTKVKVGSLNVEVIDSDTTKVVVGSHTLVVTDDGDVKWERTKPRRFNGHWGGVELGINGFVTPDFNTDWASEYDFLNLRYEKSVAVNLNLYEQNIAFNKKGNFGMLTGLGFAWNNYRFSNSTFLSPDSNYVKGFYMEDVSVRKSKLTAMYLTIPVIFEIQSNNPRRSKRLYFGAGVIGGLRLSTHTKVYFDEADKEYYLRDPKTGNLLDPTYHTYRTPNSNSRNIVKNFNSFNLRPFKLDATVRVGYGIVNLFASYSLLTMFEKNRGPELYPWQAGITIVGW